MKGWENSRQLSRVCITVSNSPNPSREEVKKCVIKFVDGGQTITFIKTKKLAFPALAFYQIFLFLFPSETIPQFLWKLNPYLILLEIVCLG